MKRKIKRHLILLKYYKQQTSYSCGIVCLRMLLERFGQDYSEKYLRDLGYCDKDGTEMSDLKEILKILGFKGYSRYNVSLKQLIEKLNKNIPLIVGLGDHWEIVVGYDKKYIFIADPNYNKHIRMGKKRFLKLWKIEYNRTLEIR